MFIIFIFSMLNTFLLLGKVFVDSTVFILLGFQVSRPWFCTSSLQQQIMPITYTCDTTAAWVYEVQEETFKHLLW